MKDERLGDGKEADQKLVEIDSGAGGRDRFCVCSKRVKQKRVSKGSKKRNRNRKGEQEQPGNG